ncbi:hypothetical protein WDU94_012832 [Cyamophila willieti]
MVNIHVWSLLALLFILGNALAGENDSKESPPGMSILSQPGMSLGLPAIPRKIPTIVRRGFGLGAMGGFLGASAYSDYKQMKRERKYGSYYNQPYGGQQMPYGGPQMPYGGPQMPYGGHKCHMVDNKCHMVDNKCHMVRLTR